MKVRSTPLFVLALLASLLSLLDSHQALSIKEFFTNGGFKSKKEKAKEDIEKDEILKQNNDEPIEDEELRRNEDDERYQYDADESYGEYGRSYRNNGTQDQRRRMHHKQRGSHSTARRPSSSRDYDDYHGDGDDDHDYDGDYDDDDDTAGHYDDDLDPEMEDNSKSMEKNSRQRGRRDNGSRRHSYTSRSHNSRRGRRSSFSNDDRY
ncbi:MAG: hypothetical protein MHMPM18_001334 [Marteilia pararefringens]